MAVEKPAATLDDADIVMCGVGILMERYRCDSHEAGDMLLDWSRNAAVGPEEVARWLMEDTITRSRAEGP